MNFKERLDYARTKRSEQRSKEKKSERRKERFAIFVLAPLYIGVLLKISGDFNNSGEFKGWAVLGFVACVIVSAWFLYMFVNVVVMRTIHCKQLVCSRLLVVNNEKDREVIASIGPGGLEVIGPDGKGSVRLSVKDGGGHVELKRGGDNFHKWHPTYPDDEVIEGNLQNKSDEDEYIPSIEGDEDELPLVVLSTDKRMHGEQVGWDYTIGGKISVNMETEDDGNSDEPSAVEAIGLVVHNNSGRIITSKKDEEDPGFGKTTEIFGDDESDYTISQRLYSIENRVAELERARN